MANELQLVLEKNIEELTPKLIAFNNAELMASVEARLKTYEGIEYSDEQIGEAKKDRAQLNAFCTALNAERLRIGKIYQQPYENFKNQVDEVIAKVKTVSSKIDDTVKAYETKKQAEKKEVIEAYFNEVIGDYETCITFDKILQPKWLNASVPLSTVKKDIDALIENVGRSIIAIEALNSPDENYVKAYYFRTLDLSAALTESARLQKDREEAERLKALKVEREKAIAEANKTDAPPVSPKIAQESAKDTENEKVVVKFGVEATKAQIKALKEFLTTNNIKYFAV